MNQNNVWVLTCWYYKYKALLFGKHLSVTSVSDFILELILKGNFCIKFHFQFIEHLVSSFIQKHKHRSHNIPSQNQSMDYPGLPFHTVWLYNALTKLRSSAPSIRCSGEHESWYNLQGNPSCHPGLSLTL